jgi:putative transposase
MAKKAVTDRGVCIRVACDAFRISESCYRYERKLDAENVEVANWLIRLTDNHHNWGFGLCYLYLRNVKGFKWNHKRVYRIYKEAGAQFTDQASQTPCAREARSLGGAERN